MKRIPISEQEKLLAEEKTMIKAGDYRPWLRVLKVEGDSIYCEIPYISRSNTGKLLVIVPRNSIEQIAKEDLEFHPVDIGIFFVGALIGVGLSFVIISSSF